MAAKDTAESIDVSSLENHLAKALACTESESAKYHLREACQKVVILEEND